jgi:apolipoprotein N-acyltransferase
MGNNGSVDTVLPFGTFAPTLAHTPLVLLGRFVGFYGLSALFVVLVTSVAFKKLRIYSTYVIAISIALLGISWLAYRTPSGTDMTASIQADETEKVYRSYETSAELVLVPEYGIPGFGLVPDIKSNDDKDVYFLGSTSKAYEDISQNVLVFGSTKQGVLEQVPKTRLIPAGEYLPYAADWILHAIDDQESLKKFKYTRAIKKGDRETPPLKIREGVVLGSGVCASIIAPEDYRKLSNQGATVLTNSAMLGIFDSAVFTFEHEGLARFNAAANARPFLQSSTMGNAFAIDHSGRIIKKISPSNIADVTVKTNSRKTPYTILGEWVVYVGLIIIFYALIKKVMRLVKKRVRK